MAIELREFDTLDEAKVSQILSEQVQRVQEIRPASDLSRGVLHDMVIYLSSLLEGQQQQNVEDYLNARSLKAISEDPALSDPDLVDDAVSNFRVVRKAGNKAGGTVTITLTNNVTTVIPAASLFQGNGLNFLTTDVFVAKSEASQISSANDRLIRSIPGGKFAFDITVEAEETGEAYRLKKDTLVVPANKPTNYLTSFAASDFEDGLADETNEELMTRLQTGIAAKAFSNRINMLAMLREKEEFSRVLASSIIGFGDEELIRSVHTIFPVHLGSRCDWYIRTVDKLARVRLEKTAVLVEKTSDGRGIWQFSVGKDEAPGFYTLENIQALGTTGATGGYAITEETRAADLTEGGFQPDIVAAVEGVYSRYQTAVVKFKDTDTVTASLSLGATKSYQLEAVALPLIADIQDFLNTRDIRAFSGDCLVKAPVPCIVQLSMTIFKRSGDADPDLTAIKDDLAAAVNNTGFVGHLYASELHDVVHNRLAASQKIGAVDMFGQIRDPSGALRYLRSTEVLEVPNDAADMVSEKTVQFFTEPGSIAVAIETVFAAE